MQKNDNFEVEICSKFLIDMLITHNLLNDLSC